MNFYRKEILPKRHNMNLRIGTALFPILTMIETPGSYIEMSARELVSYEQGQSLTFLICIQNDS